MERRRRRSGRTPRQRLLLKLHETNYSMNVGSFKLHGNFNAVFALDFPVSKKNFTETFSRSSEP